jgi:hypothetical protein
MPIPPLTNSLSDYALPPPEKYTASTGEEKRAHIDGAIIGVVLI